MSTSSPKTGLIATDVGELPADWSSTCLGDHFEITSSKRVFQKDWRSSGVAFYRARELAVLAECGRVDNELFIDRTMFERYRKEFGAPEPGDIMVTGVGTLGKTYVVKTGDEFYFKDGNIIWLKCSRSVDSEFLRQLYLSPLVIRQIFDSSSGTTVGTYTITNAKKTRIPLPPRGEQSRIAQALGDADRLISSTARLISKKRAIKQGMMQQLLTGKTRLPGFARPWREVRLDDVAIVTMGQSPGGASYNSAAIGLPLVQGNADIRDRRTIDRVWTSKPTKRCQAGDVILTVRAPVGYAAAASRAACLGRGVCGLSTKSDNRFLYHALVHGEPRWSVFEQGSTFTAVNSSEVRSFAVAWPSDGDERRAIAEALDSVDCDIQLLIDRISKDRAVKQGMMQELLTGRTRLPAKGAA